MNKKIAGFCLVQQGSPISDDRRVWDISEFFIMKKRQGLFTGATIEPLKGPWQVRVLVSNQRQLKNLQQQIPQKLK
jgi:hypothetical protein